MSIRDSGYNLSLRFKDYPGELTGEEIRTTLEAFCEEAKIIGQKPKPSIGNLMEYEALALHHDHELASAALKLVTHIGRNSLPTGQRNMILAMLQSIKYEFDVT